MSLKDLSGVTVTIMKWDRGFYKNPLEEVFPNSYSVGEQDLDAFEKKKDEIVTILTVSAPYWKRLENITSEAFEKS
jgi:hypothetical protein